MTRTYRRQPRCFRNPTTLNTQKIEQRAKDELTEYGNCSSIRLRIRANKNSNAIVTAYDDIRYNTRERTKSSLKYRFKQKSSCGNIKYIEL
jgi:hypothetical protein